MTFAEAKDKVANKKGYIDYFHFSKNENCLELAYLCDEANELHAASVREEAYHEGYQDAYNQYPHKYQQSSEPPAIYSDDLPY